MEYARLAQNPRAAVATVLAHEASGLAVSTSGSSGTPREVLIGADAVAGSVDATAARIGTGSWLLALPPDRIGGALVIARALAAGTPLHEVAPGADAQEFAEAAAHLAGPRFTSLVPTQVVRLAATRRGRAALASFDAVLVGGAPLPDLGLDAPLISTYGATETCGGCVYDGTPLDGVRVRTDAEGRIEIAGPTLAEGYADGDNSSFIRDDEGARWFRTSDVGAFHDALRVDGRADDVIISGGLKVHPARVESALVQATGIEAAAVAGVPDPEWGQRVVAWVTTASAAAVTIEQIRAELADRLAPHELPKELVEVSSLPRAPGGKIDRTAMRALALAHGRSPQ